MIGWKRAKAQCTVGRNQPHSTWVGWGRTDIPVVIQANLGGIAGSVPDHRNEVSISTKRVTVFLLAEGLAYNL